MTGVPQGLGARGCDALPLALSPGSGAAEPGSGPPVPRCSPPRCPAPASVGGSRCTARLGAAVVPGPTGAGHESTRTGPASWGPWRRSQHAELLSRVPGWGLTAKTASSSSDLPKKAPLSGRVRFRRVSLPPGRPASTSLGQRSQTRPWAQQGVCPRLKGRAEARTLRPRSRSGRWIGPRVKNVSCRQPRPPEKPRGAGASSGKGRRGDPPSRHPGPAPRSPGRAPPPRTARSRPGPTGPTHLPCLRAELRGRLCRRAGRPASAGASSGLPWGARAFVTPHPV